MESTKTVVDQKTHWIVRQAVSADTLALLSDYTRLKAKVAPKRHKHADPLQFVHREYGDALMETLLEKLTPLVEQVTGLSLWPTLSFYYVYQQGNELKQHKDRSSCQIVAGLCIDADENFKMKKGQWPLMFELNGSSEAVHLNYGDMVIFKGHDMLHWRTPYTGEWFVSAIFGYVDKKGPFAFQKYDQRQMLGKPHVGMFYWLGGCMKQKIKEWWQACHRHGA